MLPPLIYILVFCLFLKILLMVCLCWMDIITANDCTEGKNRDEVEYPYCRREDKFPCWESVTDRLKLFQNENNNLISPPTTIFCTTFVGWVFSPPVSERGKKENARVSLCAWRRRIREKKRLVKKAWWCLGRRVISVPKVHGLRQQMPNGRGKCWLRIPTNILYVQKIRK